MLSKSLISNSRRASLSLSEILLSSTLGLAFPLGWLCTNITPDARHSTAYFATSRTSTGVPHTPPCEILAYPITLFALFISIINALS